MPISDFEKAKSYFLEGIFHAENEKWEQAEAAFKASQEILPGRASTVSNLLGVLVAQKKYDEAWLLVNDALLLVTKIQKQTLTSEFCTTSHKILKTHLNF